MFVLSFLSSTDRCLFLIRSAVSWKEACLTTLRTYPSIAKRTCAVFLNKVRRTRLCFEIILTYGGLITNVWGILKKVIRQSETGITLFLLIRLNWKLYIKIQFLIKKSDMSIFEWWRKGPSGVLKSNFWYAAFGGISICVHTDFESDTNCTHFLSQFGSQGADCFDKDYYFLTLFLNTTNPSVERTRVQFTVNWPQFFW